MNEPTPTPPAEGETFQALLEFFKALADPNRLRIIGMLAYQPLSGEQMAEMLKLRASTVSHHLSYLVHVGLVSARPESYYNIYSFRADALEKMARQLLRSETLPAIAADVDVDAYDRKVLKDFCTTDGKIKAFPAQRKKFEAVLRYVLKAFQPGVRYSEKEVNQIIARFNEDTATLRRELVDYHWLKREGGGGAYWRPVEPEPQPTKD
jgi:predicted transcriptional regulator